MTDGERNRLFGFYENELTNNLLYYWLERCEDKINGGFFNCYDNTGKNLMSTDKYIWSQARFVWIYAAMADTKAPIFSKGQRLEFQRLARQGRDFLKKYCLIAPNDYRCVYLTDEKGKHKVFPGYDVLDSSIYADCFVVNAFSKVALMDRDSLTWEFAKKLYVSITNRLESGRFHTLPYPMDHAYRAHGIPMIMTNVAKEMYEAALVMEPDYADNLRETLKAAVEDTLYHFVDRDGLVREVITSDNKMLDCLFGTHMNPGHTLENIWFILDAMKIIKELDTSELLAKLCHIALRALEAGWDKEYGGIFHYAAIEGGPLTEDGGEFRNEPVLQYALKNTTGKIWWVHSEALYTCLRLYMLTGREEFWNWYEKIEEYVFMKFPNPDREVREWIQALDRFGNPRKESVGLPVKDPYHIMRNVLLTIELLNESQI